MRSDRHIYSEALSTGQKKLVIIAICILLVGLVAGGAVIGSYFSEVNFYNSDEGAKIRAEIDDQISKLEEKQRQEWIKNSCSEKYYEYEEQINTLIEKKNEKPPTRTICYGMFPIIFALTIATPLLVFGLSKKKE